MNTITQKSMVTPQKKINCLVQGVYNQTEVTHKIAALPSSKKEL
jgi:hypothetical protein